MTKRFRPWHVLAAAAILAVTGCGASIPTDPEGTLDRVTNGELRVGASENGTWVLTDEGSEPGGIEPELVREFAETMDAAIEWVPGAEHELVEDLEHGELDLIVGGLANDTPWSKQAGLTRPYVETTDERGKTIKHVMLVRQGENAFLVRLDRFLLGRTVTP